MWQLDKIDAFELAEYMSAKFTHDIAGVLGAIESSLDYINDEDAGMQEKARQLLQTSAFEAVARLKFFRQAYGNTPLTGEADLALLRELAQNWLKNSKVRLFWSEADIGAIPFKVDANKGKLILNLLVIAVSCLIYGGEITISAENGQLKIIGTAKKFKFDEQVQKLLIDQNRSGLTIDAKNIQIYYSSILAQKHRIKLDAVLRDDGFSFIIS